MRSLILLFTVLLFSQFSWSQKDKDIPAWGKIDKADLQLKECEFEKDADAMVLLEKGEVVFQRGARDLFSIKREVRVRYKIFNDRGFHLADVKIPYYSDGNYEKLSNIEAVTYNMDASGKVTETKVDKKSFFRQKLDSRRSALTFTFPEVKAGSILEFRYNLVRESISTVDPWVFQNQIPTRISSFEISFPEYLRFVTNTSISLPIETKRNEAQESMAVTGGTVRFKTEEYSYKMRNIPALKAEPYMAAARDYLQRIDFQISQIIPPGEVAIDLRNTWPRLVKSLMESSIFGEQLKKNLSMGADYKALVAGSRNVDEKIINIYHYVQQAMDWNGVDDYYCESVKDSWAKKAGSTGDINLILLNLLRDADIVCYPVLASTRSHGRVFSAYPMLSQFNSLLVYVQSADKTYILDAAAKYHQAGLIPADVIGTEAFVVDEEKMGFITLWNELNENRNVIAITGVIEGNDQFTGNVNMSSSLYARNPRVSSYKQGKDKYINRFLSGEVSNMKIDELEITNLEADSLSLDQSFRFSVPVTNSGDYKFFTLNLFSGLEKNPFVAEKRATQIDFGYNQNYTMVGSVSIPEDHQFEGLPQNVMMIMPDTSIVFRRVMQANGNRLNYRITLQFKRPSYTVEEYEIFREFYKKLFASLTEQIVYKKKA